MSSRTTSAPSPSIVKFVAGVAVGTVERTHQSVNFTFKNGRTASIMTNPDGTFRSAVAFSDGACLGSYASLARLARVAA